MKKTIHYLLILFLPLLISSCEPNQAGAGSIKPMDTASQRVNIAQVLDTFHATAARADYNGYFNCLSEDAVFMGTDATEHWTKPDFMQWAKPFFDRKSAWNFTSVQKHIYFSEDGRTAWFDELLQTQMKICRGSGVLSRQQDSWKIEQYVLSMTIPNALSDRVTELKASTEDSLLQAMFPKR